MVFRPEDVTFDTHECGFLHRWLQPDSYADPQKTALILNKDDIRCGWPATVVVQTKDQYGDVVHVPNMKVRQQYLDDCKMFFYNYSILVYPGHLVKKIVIKIFLRLNEVKKVQFASFARALTLAPPGGG